MANEVVKEEDRFFKYSPGFQYEPKEPETVKTGAVDEKPVAKGAKVKFEDLKVARGAKAKSDK